jgi:hypothetical protein
MRKRLSNDDPLGRLHEPLHALATRVHRAMGRLRKTIWADESGKVFLENINHTASASPRWIVGTYVADTSVWQIEEDLRHALRARASRWITDWEALPPASRHQLIRMVSSKRPRCRPLKRFDTLSSPQPFPMPEASWPSP